MKLSQVKHGRLRELENNKRDNVLHESWSFTESDTDSSSSPAALIVIKKFKKFATIQEPESMNIISRS